MTGNIKGIIRNITIFIEIMLFIGIFVLEYLAKERMGVMRSLVYRKSVLEATWFTPFNLNLLYYIFVGGIIISLFLIIISFISNIKDNIIGYFINLFLHVIALIVISSDALKDLYTFHFLLIIVLFNLIISWVRIIKYFYSNKFLKHE